MPKSKNQQSRENKTESRTSTANSPGREVDFVLECNGAEHVYVCGGFRPPVPAVQAQTEFTIEEHLRVQREIEERAHRFWFAKGCALKSALDDWLKAENEVLAEFAKTLMQRQQGQPASGETQEKIRGHQLCCQQLLINLQQS